MRQQVIEDRDPPAAEGLAPVAADRWAEGDPARLPSAAQWLARTVIEPARGWQLINFGELWQFRELLFFLVWRDVKVRYKQTVLGAAWAVLQPALMMVVFTVFFGRMANVPTGGIPYPLFVYAGLLPWTFFATAISSAGNSVVGSERLISKIYFPRLAVPFATVGASVIDFFIAFGLLILLMIYYGTAPGAGLLFVPLLLGLLTLVALGIGTLLSALNVYYRDFRYVIPFLVQIGMFATPAVYMAPKDHDQSLISYGLLLNPINAVVAAFREAILGQSITWGPLAVAGALSGLIFLGGCLYFRHLEQDFADVI